MIERTDLQSRRILLGERKLKTISDEINDRLNAIELRIVKIMKNKCVFIEHSINKQIMPELNEIEITQYPSYDE